MKTAPSQSDFMYGYQTLSNRHIDTEYSLVDRAPSHALLHVVSQLKHLQPHSSVIDLGCGDGLLELLAGAERNYSFTSIDLEPSAINSLKKVFEKQNHPQHDHAIVGDITQLNQLDEIRPHSFDAAVSWRVIHGISPQHYSSILSYLHTHLKKGALFYLSVACDKDWKVAALGDDYDPQGVNNCTKVMFQNFGIDRTTPFPVHFFSLDELTAYGRQAGFEPIAVDYFEESSGYTHLQDKLNTYIFVIFRNS